MGESNRCVGQVQENDVYLSQATASQLAEALEQRLLALRVGEQLALDSLEQAQEDYRRALHRVRQLVDKPEN